MHACVLQDVIIKAVLLKIFVYSELLLTLIILSLCVYTVLVCYCIHANKSVIPNMQDVMT